MMEFNPLSYDPPPSPQQMALWDKFVEEYVKDYQSVSAALRVGFSMAFAQEYGPLFLSKPYVQRKIMEHKSKPAEPEEDRLARIKQRIESVYTRAMECGDPKIAVAAAAKLGEMYGLHEPADKSGEELSKLVDAFKEIAKNVPE